MRYRLRTLLIVLARGPPVLSGAYIIEQKISRERLRKRIEADVNRIGPAGPLPTLADFLREENRRPPETPTTHDE